ncbi:MAG: sulfatase [Candidatus Sumerlaeota bacterium]|nr:sulfatase [Candidatus Sumerlaeota bacterium]
MIARRDFLKQAAWAAGALATGSKRFSLAASDPPSRPNILYVLCDQWRGQALSCAGDPNIQTTNLDALAAAGARFTRCYSNSPLCTPHRSMLMSGRWVTRTGNYVNDTLMPPAEYCLAEAFGDAGYSTGYIGKWHLDGADKPGYVVYRQGWQWWAGFNRGHVYWNGTYFTDSDTPLTVPPGVFEPVHQTNMAVDWIAQRTSDPNPWFLMVSFGGPHTPYTAPQAYLDQFTPSAFTLRPNVPPADEATARANLKGYYAHAKCLDDNIGRLIQALADNGFTQNTLVCFTSDHGDMHYSQGQTFKSKPWEESANVPFIAKWPQAIPAGRVVPALFSTIDIYPTLCGLAGIPVPSGKDGVDYSHLFRGESGPERDAALLTIGTPTSASPWRGVVTATHTYAWYPKQGTGWVLYDNVADPYQMNNLVGQPGAAALEAEMRQRSIDLLRAVDDPLAGDSGVSDWRRM